MHYQFKFIGKDKKIMDAIMKATVNMIIETNNQSSDTLHDEMMFRSTLIFFHKL